ncbi:MAG: hypothetical protein CMJ40_09335 [Phycisphaerae bacterium]|nr:hypothetical protein [Phycisphaerae bacterium]
MLIGLMVRVSLLIALVGVMPVQAGTQACWDFNQYDGDARRIKADSGEGDLVLGEDWNERSVSNPSGTKLNMTEPETAGMALSLSGMARNGKQFELFLPVEACGGTKVSAAVRRSGTGFSTLRMAISVDGGKTFREGPVWSIGETWAVHSADLPLAEPSSQLILRFEVDGASSSRGTILLDNLKIACQREGSKKLEE